ncbi:MAG: hypothetical protein KF851_16225 [Pirellulaceae bacterium]|nr:hypothetical protein [Pirellulaceae bacterium]
MITTRAFSQLLIERALLLNVLFIFIWPAAIAGLNKDDDPHLPSLVIVESLEVETEVSETKESKSFAIQLTFRLVFAHDLRENLLYACPGLLHAWASEFHVRGPPAISG